MPVDWQFAVPIAPAGDEVIVTASVWAKLPSYPGGEVTSELCAQRIQASRPPEPLDPPLELQPDKVFTTDRQIFNFVLPPSLAVGDVKLTAYITARSPGTDAGGDKLLSDATAVANVPFHRRRAVRIRYERWQSMSSPSPTDGECFTALRLRAKLGES